MNPITTDAIPVITVAQAIPLLQTMDLLLWRRDPLTRGDIVEEMITIAGGTNYYHAGALIESLICGKLFPLVVHTRMFKGCHISSLQELVNESPGHIIVFRLILPEPPHFRSLGAAELMSYLGKPYGWRAIERRMLAYLPGFRWVYRPQSDEWENGHAPYCSDLYSMACNAGGIDPVPDLASSWTTPSHLANSGVFGKIGLLVP